MTDIELYKEVGKWINRYHRYDWYYTGLLEDFKHDVWLKLREKTVNISYIKQSCYNYPLNAIRYMYYRKTNDFAPREVVLLDEQGGYVEFAADPFIPFEFDIKKKTTTVSKYRKHHDVKRVSVRYVSGVTEEFESVTALADVLSVNTATVYRHIGKPLEKRFTKRKMSHIDVINYI
jgi:hypothetical protein